MKFIDLFAGIGGFRLGLERQGHECVGWIEKDKFARKSYEAIHDTEGEYTARDIREVEPGELPEHDMLTGGFPCQSFSFAGERGGFDDTRGTLFFEILRLAKERQPEFLFLENVRGLLSHDGGATFGTIINSLADVGYECEWQVLNSKNFGVPQNRERVFIIGHIGGISGREVFPIKEKGERFNENELQEQCGSNIQKVFSVRMSEKKRRNVQGDRKIRRMTPKEYWRLQGFDDSHFTKAEKVNSDTQLYKQAGNSVTVNVIESIGERF